MHKDLADMADDDEMREMAAMEIAEIEAKLPAAEEELKILLLPKDPNDEKNVILEIRAGTGGDEATLFAAEILRMYARYAERQGWKMDILEASDNGMGGIKDATAVIEGDNVYSKMRFESASTASNACRKPRRKAAFTHPRSPSQFFPRPKRLMSRSIPMISGSIISARPAPADSR